MVTRSCTFLILVKRRDFLTLCGLAAGSVLIPKPIARLIRDTCVLAGQPLILPHYFKGGSNIYAVHDGGDYTLQFYMDWDFELRESPMAQAFHYLNDLPLCPEDTPINGDPLGRLCFIEGDRPGSNLTYVRAADLATLACLQHRLYELDEFIHIEIR